MKKHTAIMIFIATAFIALGTVLLTACGGFSAGGSGRRFGAEVCEQVVRIHIRANSNSEGDQNVKLKVRDAVTTYLGGRLERCESKGEALNRLSDLKRILQDIAENTLKVNGFDYKAAVQLGKEDFPEKAYDGYIFPAGCYDALIIELGTGKGDNWWCVAFPPLCFIPDSLGGEKIVYKSWVKEQLDRIFGKR